MTRTGAIKTFAISTYQRIPLARSVHTSAPLHLAMRPGTKVPGLDFMKNQEAPASLPRDQYPGWVSELAKPLVTLAELRRMTWEDSTDKDKMRYLKLSRRIKIKNRNVEAGA
jgi:hypothetical protein